MTVTDTPLKKKEQKKEWQPISEKWRPDAAGMQLGAEVFGAELENEIADHRDHLLKNDIRFADYGAAWRKRCRHWKRNPQFQLPLRARGAQLGVGDCGHVKRQDPPAPVPAELKKALSALRSADNQASKLAAVRAAGKIFGGVKSQWTAKVWQFAVDDFSKKAIEEGLDEDEAWTVLEEGIRCGERLAPNSRRLGRTTFVVREFIRPARKKEVSG